MAGDFVNDDRRLFPASTISDLIHHYYQKGGRKGNNDQRLGQWWYNEFDRSGQNFPELFYADDHVAGKLIWEHYCEVE